MRKIHAAVLSAAVLSGLATLGVYSIPAAADSLPPAAPATPALATAPALAPAPALPALTDASPATDRLRDYALILMRGWPGGKYLPAADYDDVATSIAEASKTAHDVALLAGLGYWEGARYAAYVDSLQCNDRAWRSRPEAARLMRVGGDCDHGSAMTIWQIHPIVDVTSRLYDACSRAAVTVSRTGAARCALALATASLARSGDLSSYTGEWGPEHPKADVRLAFIDKALSSHPLRP